MIKNPKTPEWLKKDYDPFGMKWNTEMMKWKKKEIILFLKETLIENLKLKQHYDNKI